MILIAAFIAQQHGWPVILRDEQVGRAVVVVVAGDDGARIFQLNLVEANVGGDIFESVWPKVAEQAHFAFAVFRLADGDEVDPAVVVVVEGGDAVGVHPIRDLGSATGSKLSVVVAPERESRRSCLGEGEVHPTVVVEIENRHAKCWKWIGHELSRLELPFSWVLENFRHLLPKLRRYRQHDRCCSQCRSRQQQIRSPPDRLDRSHR